MVALLALACTTAMADVRVVVDMNGTAPGFQSRIDVAPGTTLLRDVGVHVFASEPNHACWGIGYIGGLDRGIAFGHMPRGSNVGTVTALTPHGGAPINPGNAQELLSPAHQPAFTGPELQYLEFGASEPESIRTDLGPAVFTVDVSLEDAAAGDVFDFYVLDMVSVWSGSTHGAFSTTAGLSLDTGGDAVPDGTMSDYGADPDTPIAIPPGAYRVDFVDGGANTGGATIRVASSLGVESTATPALRWHPARPQPFRSGITFGFELAHSALVSLEVFDLAGRRVKAVFDGATLDAGAHEVGWDGRDAGGVNVAAGMYVCRLVAGRAALTQRVVRLP